MSGTTQVKFAALVRVSTEKQEKFGESLRTQSSDISAAVKHHAGSIVEWYGGQEHGTPGFEKKEIDRLLADAQAGRFDAVMVASADRWSRDNSKSRAGLEVFKAQRVRFFVVATEYDLFNPEHSLFLGMSAVIGQFQAQHQNRKSILNRIERAKRGLPTCGKLPFGRDWDKSTQRWVVDPVKQRMMEDVARRYLSGEPLPKLAAAYGVNHSNLHKTLTLRCGSTWQQEFRSDDLNIRATVSTTIPPLLPDDTVRAVLERVRANKTYSHGQIKHRYLFSRMLFCARCGYAMFGQTNHNGKRYYRHAHAKRERACTAPAGWVDANALELTVTAHLFDVFGNPLAMQRAVEQALPDSAKIESVQKELKQIGRDLDEVTRQRQRLVAAVAKGLLADEDVRAKMADLNGRETDLQGRSARLLNSVQDIPDPEAVKCQAERLSREFRRRASAAFSRRLASQYENMTWEDKRRLAELVFGGRTSDGRRMGVYVEAVPAAGPNGERLWKYELKGHLVGSWGWLSDDEEYGPGIGYDDSIAAGPNAVEKLLEVTRSASYSPSKSSYSLPFLLTGTTPSPDEPPKPRQAG